MTNELICYICNKQDHKGIVVKEQYICRACEEDIVNTPPSDGKYDEYKEKIKEMLFS